MKNSDMKKIDKLCYQRNDTNKPKIKIINIQLLVYFFIKWILIVMCVLFVFLFVKEIAEYKEVFFTYNAMEQIESMYKGNFTLLYPEINTSETNVTPNRVLSF